MTPPTSFLVRIRAEEIPDSAELTGFLTAPQYVMTCAHAVLPGYEQREPLDWSALGALPLVKLRVRFENGEETNGRVVAYAAPDCALVRLARRSRCEPARLLDGYRDEHEGPLIAARPVVTGYPAAAPEEAKYVRIRRFVSVLSGHGVVDYQIEGGLLAGMSGGPALMQVREEWLCFGMAYLGRAGSATSRLVSSQVLLKFARRQGVKCPRAANADECCPSSGLAGELAY